MKIIDAKFVGDAVSVPKKEAPSATSDPSDCDRVLIDREEFLLLTKKNVERVENVR